MISERLKKVRERAGLTQLEFSKEIGVAVSTYNAYEQGTSFPKSDVLVKVCDLYSVSADWLLGTKAYSFTDTYADMYTNVENLVLWFDFVIRFAHHKGVDGDTISYPILTTAQPNNIDCLRTWVDTSYLLSKTEGVKSDIHEQVMQLFIKDLFADGGKEYVTEELSEKERKNFESFLEHFKDYSASLFEDDTKEESNT